MTRWKSTLRIRMMLSHTFVSIAAVLLLETLCTSVVLFVVVFSPRFDATELGNAERIAHSYAQLASNRVGTGSSLDPEITFAPNTPATLTPTEGDTNNPDVTTSVPYIASPYPGSRLVAFALLIAPDGSVLASSDPREYPIHVPAVTFLSSRYSLVAHALKGEGEKLIVGTATGRIGQASVPVFNQNGVGLQSMRERIEVFGGTLRIESRYGEGTRIVAYCPSPNYKESHGEAQFMVPLLPDKEVTE
jgi:hypothetical protein